MLAMVHTQHLDGVGKELTHLYTTLVLPERDQYRGTTTKTDCWDVIGFVIAIIPIQQGSRKGYPGHLASRRHFEVAASSEIRTIRVHELGRHIHHWRSLLF
jgi:hypothetical protein